MTYPATAEREDHAARHRRRGRGELFNHLPNEIKAAPLGTAQRSRRNGTQRRDGPPRAKKPLDPRTYVCFSGRSLRPFSFPPVVDQLILRGELCTALHAVSARDQPGRSADHLRIQSLCGDALPSRDVANASLYVERRIVEGYPEDQRYATARNRRMISTDALHPHTSTAVDAIAEMRSAATSKCKSSRRNPASSPAICAALGKKPIERYGCRHRHRLPGATARSKACNPLATIVHATPERHCSSPPATRSRSD